MKVLQISKFYPPDHGGIEAVARELSVGLTARGVAVQVLCAHKRLRNVQDTDAVGVPVTRAASFGLLLSTSMAPGLPLALRQRRHWPDIVHVHMPDPLAAMAVWWARPPGRVVVHWHSDVVRQRLSMALYRPLQDWLLRRADAVVATSPAYAEASVPLQAFRNKRVVVPLGAPAPRPPTAAAVASTRARYGGRRIVFSLGRLTYYKGYEVLIRAAAALPPDVVVVIGGGGDRLAHYQRLAQAAGMADRVRFVGPMSAARVEAHFAAAEVFCLASTLRAEAFGVAVVEAMARGLPVVATAIPGSGLGWVHQHGVTGLQVPPGDAPALAQALNTLLDDAELRQRCGQAGRARWAAHFTAETMADAMLALYRQLLGAEASTEASAEAPCEAPAEARTESRTEAFTEVPRQAPRKMPSDDPQPTALD